MEKFPLYSPAEHDHIPPSPPAPEVTGTYDPNIASAASLFENKVIECKEQNDTSLSETECTPQVGANDSDLSSEKIEHDKMQPSAALSYICFASEISVCSLKQEKINVSSETTSICSNSSSPHLTTSALNQSSSQNVDTDFVSPTTENSSICEFILEELSSSEIDLEIPGAEETPPNVFFPKGEIYEQNVQICEAVENTTELCTEEVQTPTPDQRHKWVLMNHKYIQKEGYRLGIRPGTFYSSNDGYFVEVPNGVNYEIILTNENPVPCNIDVLIDNIPKPVICFRLNPGKPVKFDGPTFCENKFVFLRSMDAPTQSGIKPSDTSNGIIQATFTPQKVENVRTRAVSEPIPFSRNFSNALEMLGIEEKTRKMRSYTTSCSTAERGTDIARFCPGATALRGEQTPKAFKRADYMEVDETRQVHMRLRLIARIDDPSVPSEEDICSMYPPSIEELLEIQAD